MPATPICSACGTPNRPGANFCKDCGISLEIQPKANFFRRRKRLLIGLTLASFTVFVWIVLIVDFSTPDSGITGLAKVTYINRFPLPEGWPVEYKIPTPAPVLPTPVSPLVLYDDNRDGVISCFEAREHGRPVVFRSDRLFPYMENINLDGADGMICEQLYIDDGSGDVKEERVVASKVEAVAFKSMGEWSKKMCGDKNFVKDSLKDEWKEQDVSPHRIDGIGQGWIGNQGDDGRITRSDFPRVYIFTGRGKFKIAGETIRPLFQETRQYNFDCSVRRSTITDRGFD